MNYKKFWDGVPLPKDLEDRVLRAAEEHPARHPFPWKRTVRPAEAGGEAPPACGGSG